LSELFEKNEVFISKTLRKDRAFFKFTGSNLSETCRPRENGSQSNSAERNAVPPSHEQKKGIERFRCLLSPLKRCQTHSIRKIEDVGTTSGAPKMNVTRLEVVYQV
jgi:hypothetical protein